MEQAAHPKGIVVLDFGGQYAHLIASRIRRMGVFAEVAPAETPAKELAHAAGIILSGGPQSVYDPKSPTADPRIFSLGIPILGICYGLQWMTQALGGEVKPGTVKEYGPALLTIVDKTLPIARGLPKQMTVWMSHGDEAVTLPEGCSLIGTSESCRNAMFGSRARRIYAVQFHPEVVHTEHGTAMLQNFVAMCDADSWSVEGYAKRISEEIVREVGDRNVFMLVSGGVDSTVAFTLLNEVLGADRVKGLLIDTGLMRKNEVRLIREAFARLGITNLSVEDASEEFFRNLRGVSDPEEKRRVIGQTFLDVQKRVANRLIANGSSEQWMLGQGTIYPDTIETGGTPHADHIKTHHNRIETIAKMIEEGRVIEPLKDLYKDEVRILGEELGLPHELVWRHPFPGPGLGVRILCGGREATDALLEANVPHAVLPVRSVGVQGDGRTYRHAVALFSEELCDVPKQHRRLATEIPNRNSAINRVLHCTSHTEPPAFVSMEEAFVTRDRADLLREADAIVDEEMREASLEETIWQFPVVLLPFGSKQGGQSVVLRPIDSLDAMTAEAIVLPPDVLSRMTKRIRDLPGIDCVFLDLTNKPPGTIEWE